MWKALLIDADYTHGMRLKKDVDWSSLGVTLFVEYNDVCGLEKVKSIQPHILVLGKLMYSNAEELARDLFLQNPHAKLVLVESEPPGRQDRHGSQGGQRLSESEFNTQFVESLCRQLACLKENETGVRLQNSSMTERKEKLVEILSPVREKQQLYLARILLHSGSTWSDVSQVKHQLEDCFGDFYCGCFQETASSICLILKEPEKVSVLYSIQVMGEMLESAVRYLRSAGMGTYPILVSEKTSRMFACSVYEQMTELEPYLYFCPNRMVLTWSQFQQRPSVDYTQINGLIDEMILGMLDGNPTNALHGMDEIFQRWLKPSMDFAALQFVREHIRNSIELISTIRDRDIPTAALKEPDYPSIEIEWQAVHHLILQSCHEVQQVQKEYGKILQVLRYVQKHYGETLSMEGVAQFFQVSPAYFSRQFKRILGIGFTEYVNRVRILEAKALFRAGERNVEQVANRVGYTDPKYFSRVFKRKVNLSPSSYIVQLQNET